MIYSVSFCSNSYVAKHLRQKPDAHLIMLSNKQTPDIDDTEFLTVTQMTFLDDVYSDVYEDTISHEQAKEITNTLKDINDEPELLEVVISCDTGQTCSAAVAAYIKDTYPRARSYQPINENMMNKDVLLTLKQSNYKALNTPLPIRIVMLIESADEKLNALFRRICQRSLKQNAIALMQYFRSEF